MKYKTKESLSLTLFFGVILAIAIVIACQTSVYWTHTRDIVVKHKCDKCGYETIIVIEGDDVTELTIEQPPEPMEGETEL